MTFSGINYLAVLAAAIAGFAVGMVWYGILGERWMAALGKSKDELLPDGKPPIATMAASFVCELVMAWILAGLLGHIDAVTVGGGIISACFVWLGFVATTQLVNHRYGGYPLSLTIIDTGHWLAVLIAMGVVIGLIGV
jgi:hypothetical protein